MPFAGYKDFADCVAKNSSKKNPRAYCATIMRATEASDPSPEQRKKLAKKGQALPGGGYPIPDVAHLKAAIKAIGRAKDPEATKRFIIKRAKALGRTDLLPADWSGSTKKEGELPTETQFKIRDTFDVNESSDFQVEESSGKMTATVRILKSGLSKNGRNYRESALRSAVEDGVFNGVRMFVNHSTTPPLKRSLTEMVSAIESTAFNEKDKAIDGHVTFFNKDFFEFAQRAKSFMGDSINAMVRGTRLPQPTGRVLEDISAIVHPHSVDWVIYPSAGGEIMAFESEGEDVDWDEITLDDLKTHLKPEVLTALRKETEQNPPDDDDDEDNDDPDEEPKPEEVLTKESVQAMFRQFRAEEDAKAQKRAATATKVRDFVNKAGIPVEKTRARIIAAFEGVEEYDEAAVKKAVEDAKEELAAAGAGPRIRGNGPTGSDGGAGEKASFSVRESVEAHFGIKPKKDGDHSSDDSNK